MTALPSKELLSAVLGYEANIIDDNGTLFVLTRYGAFYEDKWENDKNHPKGINIYELAHKCKEWAGWHDLKKWYQLQSGQFISASTWECELRLQDKFIDIFQADSEPEAIFKACQYILENR